MIFSAESQVEQFFNYLNGKHKNIRFTIERESEGRIPFLDLMITKNADKLDFSIFRKPTFTWLDLNFLRDCYKQYKLNSMRTLVYRAFNLSSSFLSFHHEIEFLRKYFTENGYNSDIFYQKPSITEEGLEIHFIYISMPFVVW